MYCIFIVDAFSQHLRLAWSCHGSRFEKNVSELMKQWEELVDDLELRIAKRQGKKQRQEAHWGELQDVHHCVQKDNPTGFLMQLDGVVNNLQLVVGGSSFPDRVKKVR